VKPAQTLAPQRASTRTKRELEIASGLQKMSKTNPDGFARLMKLLARLAVSEGRKEK
jgi:hypothetical protein